MPVSTLKNVVLPDPLGPMRPRTSPSSTVRSSPSSATTPPNLRVSALQRKSAPMSGPTQAPQRARHDPVRPEEEDEDDERGVEQEPVLLDDLQFLRKDDDDRGGNRQAPRVSDSPEQQDGYQDERLREAVVVRSDEPDHVRGQRAGDGREDERQGDVVEQERSLEPSDDDGLVEPPRADVQFGQLQPLRAAERVVHLEEGA